MIWSQFDKFQIRNAVLCLVGGIWSKVIIAHNIQGKTPPCFIISGNNMQIFCLVSFVKLRKNSKIGIKES